MRLNLISYRAFSILLLVTFTTLGLIYSVVTPLWEAPDEVGHFNYVTHLIQERTLPEQQLGALGEAHQPPLYYLIAAVPASMADLQDPTGSFDANPTFVWAGRGGTEPNIAVHGSAETFPFQGKALAFHLARATSVLLSTLTLVFVLAIGRELFPERGFIGLAGAALVALNPQFLFISGAVNNDSLLTLAATGALWQLLRAIKEPHSVRAWMYVGIWLGIGLLTKLNAVVWVGVAGGVLIACASRHRSSDLGWRGALGLLIPIVILTGWWFLRNQQLYGDPLGWRMYEQVFAVNLRSTPLQMHDLREFFGTQFRSFWGVFGWMTLPAPPWYYQFARLLSLVSVVGIVVFLWRYRQQLSSYQKAGLFLLGSVIVAQELYMIAVITTCNASCYQGRYLFPVIGPLMLLAAMGWYALLPRRWNVASLSAALLVLGYAALTFPFQVIEAGYGIVPLDKWELRRIPHQTSYKFDHQFRLHGHKLEGTAPLSLTLYWEALQEPIFDYSAFVHLIDQNDHIIAQDDHAPGSSQNYPPSRWQVGDLIADQHRLEIPASLPAGDYRLRVGLYDWSTGEQLPVFQDDTQPLGSFIILEEVIRHRGGE